MSRTPPWAEPAPEPAEPLGVLKDGQEVSAGDRIQARRNDYTLRVDAAVDEGVFRAADVHEAATEYETPRMAPDALWRLQQQAAARAGQAFAPRMGRRLLGLAA